MKYDSTTGKVYEELGCSSKDQESKAGTDGSSSYFGQQQQGYQGYYGQQQQQQQSYLNTFGYSSYPYGTASTAADRSERMEIYPGGKFRSRWIAHFRFNLA